MQYIVPPITTITGDQIADNSIPYTKLVTNTIYLRIPLLAIPFKEYPADATGTVYETEIFTISLRHLKALKIEVVVDSIPSDATIVVRLERYLGAGTTELIAYRTYSETTSDVIDIDLSNINDGDQLFISIGVSVASATAGATFKASAILVAEIGIS